MSQNTDKKPVALVIGASRGIGRQIAIDLAKNGYYVVVSAKSTSTLPSGKFTPPDPNSSDSTITTVTQEIILSGNSAIAIPCDVRSSDSINDLISATVTQLGSLDAIIYNSGAIWWSAVETTPLKRFKLMQQINPEGLYATVQAALPVFEKQGHKGRIVVVCPPIYSRFFRGKTAYAMGKVGMSVLVKGLAMDFVRQEKKEMGIVGIWPAVAIQSAATQTSSRNAGMGTGGESLKDIRKPTIFSDAILAFLRMPAWDTNGQLTLDEDFLREKCGVNDFSQYIVSPDKNHVPRRIMPIRFPKLEVDEQDDEGNRVDSAVRRGGKL